MKLLIFSVDISKFDSRHWKVFEFFEICQTLENRWKVLENWKVFHWKVLNSPVAEVYSDLKLSYLRKICPWNWWRLVRTDLAVLSFGLYSSSTKGFFKKPFWKFLFKGTIRTSDFRDAVSLDLQSRRKSHMTFNPNTKPYFKCFWQKKSSSSFSV